MNIKDEWLKGTAGHVKCITKCTDNNEINRFEWFVSACAKGVPISGLLIQAGALDTAKNEEKTVSRHLMGGSRVLNITITLFSILCVVKLMMLICRQ